mmetsp:Transcript_65734/g.140622  ORF Transcript_65734/g.140622 Transcript_65734/m.140622 type:complete len:88 (+) Transcript_65734:355-618(+)
MPPPPASPTPLQGPAADEAEAEADAGAEAGAERSRCWHWDDAAAGALLPGRPKAFGSFPASKKPPPCGEEGGEEATAEAAVGDAGGR